MLRDQSRVTLYSELLRVGGFVPDQPETRDSSSFLIDRNDRLDAREIAQVVYEFSKLEWGLNVSPEENVTARLDPFEKLGGLRIEFEPGHTDKQKLT
jgi:hypothetical protein